MLSNGPAGAAPHERRLGRRTRRNAAEYNGRGYRRERGRRAIGGGARLQHCPASSPDRQAIRFTLTLRMTLG